MILPYCTPNADASFETAALSVVLCFAIFAANFDGSNDIHIKNVIPVSYHCSMMDLLQDHRSLR